MSVVSGVDHSENGSKSRRSHFVIRFYFQAYQDGPKDQTTLQK